ncbi:MAG: hypothetical protein C0407_09595 [Desulfobacca sp.]|nr:hypothetical protein [Desulfobacca sp.]
MNRLWAKSKENLLAEQGILVAASSPWLEAILTSLQSAGITPQTAKTLEEAIHSLEFHQPGFLLLSDQFCSSHDRPDPLLGYTQRMPTALRRELFVVLISQTAKSGDILSAFSHSVNLVLHPDNLQDLVAHIRESWISWEDIYQIFIQTRLQLTG